MSRDNKPTQEASAPKVEETSAEQPKVEEVAAEQPKGKVSIRAVFGGPMVNPLTEDHFTSEPSKPVAVDDWIKVQMEAGKLAVVE